jgi:hypothetical protein
MTFCNSVQYRSSIDYLIAAPQNGGCQSIDVSVKIHDLHCFTNRGLLSAQCFDPRHHASFTLKPSAHKYISKQGTPRPKTTMASTEPIQSNPIFKTTAIQPPKTPHQTTLTLDTFLNVLSKTLLNPFIAWILVLCLRAQVTPQNDPAWIITVSYASILTILLIVRGINARVAHGVPRAVEFANEVVVVTGGASGLGLLIAQSYAMRGAKVAVLDIREFGEEEREELFGEGVLCFAVDVADRGLVVSARERIVEVVCLLSFFSFHWLPLSSCYGFGWVIAFTCYWY